MLEPAADLSSAKVPELDMVIIGAGFSGIRMLIEMREKGLRARLLERGSDVGGVWHWNRYPGARTDTEAWAYCYSFDKDLLQEWDWSDRYPDRGEVQSYLAHVTDRYKLRDDMEFDSHVTEIKRNTADNSWTVRTAEGRSYRAKFVVAATGGLSFGYRPDFPGLDGFQGEWYCSFNWPEEPVDFTGKRVGVIGTGSTGVQLIPQIAHTAGHLTVFQRTPNFVLPGRNAPLEHEQRKAIKQNYDKIWELAHSQTFGFPMHQAGRVAADATPEERTRIFEEGWEKGGFRFIFETFDDLFTDEEANAAAAEFVRGKIRAIVHDPETAEMLSPRDHPIGSKRPPFGNQYYETFNRENVSLVDVRATPIQAVTPNGIQTSAGEHELDVLVFATGYEIGTGALDQVDVLGDDGVTLAEVWRDGAQTLLGLGIAGFPNLFLVAGPHSSIGNAPPLGERVAEWVGGMLDYMQEIGADTVEAEQAAMDSWAGLLQAIVDATLLEQGKAANSWFFGANTPGGHNRIALYAAGIPGYFAELQNSSDNKYPGFTFGTSAE